MIEARGLTKDYGDKRAVDDLSFTVQPGVVTGFLGPNGSGKSTTMRLILGLDRATAGDVKVNGKHYRDLAAPLHEVGALLEARSVTLAHRRSARRRRTKKGSIQVKALLNLLWFVLAGVWMAIAYAIAGVLMFITVVGIPFGLQSFKLSGYVLWPFGRRLVQRPERMRTVSAIGNVLWFILGGWYLALGHLITGVVLCITVIGVPFGIASFKMAAAALRPMGRDVVRRHAPDRRAEIAIGGTAR